MQRLLRVTVAIAVTVSACGGNGDADGIDGSGDEERVTTNGAAPTVAVTSETETPASEEDASEDASENVAAPAATGALAYVQLDDGVVLAVDPDTEDVPWVAELEAYQYGVWAVGDETWVNSRNEDFEPFLVHLDEVGGELGRIGFGAWDIVAGDGVIWVLSIDEASFFYDGNPPLSKIDPSTHEVLGSLQSEEGLFFYEVAVGGGSAWVTSRIDPDPEPSVSRVDPESMTLAGTTPLSIRPVCMTWGEGALWAAGPPVDGGEGQIGIVRIGSDGAVEAEIMTTGIVGNACIAVGSGAAWVVDVTGTEVVRIDAATNTELARIPVGATTEGAFFIGGIFLGDGRVWVVNQTEDVIYVIDPESNLATPSIPYPGDGIAFRP